MEAFKENLNRNHGRKLMGFHFNGRDFEIRTTDHAYHHLERKYDMDVVCGNIIALGKERLYNYADQGNDVAIIDEDHDITVIITFEGKEMGANQIRIRTVIDKSNVWVKSGTRIFKLRDYKGGF